MNNNLVRPDRPVLLGAGTHYAQVALAMSSWLHDLAEGLSSP
jgi:hypothetical protein